MPRCFFYEFQCIGCSPHLLIGPLADTGLIRAKALIKCVQGGFIKMDEWNARGDTLRDVNRVKVKHGDGRLVMFNGLISREYAAFSVSAIIRNIIFIDGSRGAIGIMMEVNAVISGVENYAFMTWRVIMHEPDLHVFEHCSVLKTDPRHVKPGFTGIKLGLTELG